MTQPLLYFQQVWATLTTPERLVVTALVILALFVLVYRRHHPRPVICRGSAMAPGAYTDHCPHQVEQFNKSTHNGLEQEPTTKWKCCRCGVEWEARTNYAYD